MALLSCPSAGTLGGKKGFFMGPGFQLGHRWKAPSADFHNPNPREKEVYLLKQLRGRLALYCQSLDYLIHCQSGWSLGRQAHAYRFAEQELWLLEIEMIGDMVEQTCWQAIACSCKARHRRTGQAGHFRPTSADHSARDALGPKTYDNWNQRCRFKEYGSGLLFYGGDELLSVLFYHPAVDTPENPKDWAQQIPWPEISGRLHRAFIESELILRAHGVDWSTPPFFRGYQHWAEIAGYLNAEGLMGERGLYAVDQHWREHDGQIKRAIRLVWDEEDGAKTKRRIKRRRNFTERERARIEKLGRKYVDSESEPKRSGVLRYLKTHGIDMGRSATILNTFDFWKNRENVPKRSADEKAPRARRRKVGLDIAIEERSVELAKQEAANEAMLEELMSEQRLDGRKDPWPTQKLDAIEDL